MVFILVTTLQFGTKYCRVAYQWRSDFLHDESKVAIMKFPGTRLNETFPSSLLLDKRGNVSAFGYQACESYKPKAGDLLIENFGESMYTSEDFDERTLVKDSKGNPHRASDVFSKFLMAVCEYSNKQIASISCNHVVASDVKWVITVPSVRAERSLPFFRREWKKAGIPYEMLTAVSYPDSALTYFLYLHPNDRIDRTSLLRERERVLFIGFEDELDSYNVYEKVSGQRFKQVVHFLSGSSSRDIIMQSFDVFFSDLIGTWRWKTAKQINKDLKASINKKVDMLLERSELEKNITFSSMFTDLNEICIEHTNLTLKKILESSRYSENAKLTGEKLRIDSCLITPLFDKAINNIIHNIKHVLTMSDKEVEQIILVGNVAESGLLGHAIKKEFPRKMISVPFGAMDAALKGATLYGQNPIVISTIFCGAQVMVSK